MRVLAVPLPALFVMLTACGGGSAEKLAVLTPHSGPVLWSGAPIVNQNPAECTGPQDPACDHFLLFVRAEPGARVAVNLFSNSAADEYGVQVFYPDGTPVTRRNEQDQHAPQVHFAHRVDRGSGPYEIRIQALRATTGSWYQAVAALAARAPGGPTLDQVDFCRSNASVPEAAGIAGVTDDGRPVPLRILGLLDGVSEARAMRVMQLAAGAYNEFGLEFVVEFQRANLQGNDADRLLQQAKTAVGGRVPARAHLVHVLTAKDLRVNGSDVAGFADCIGGIEDRTRAFSIGEVYADDPDGRSLAMLPLQSHWSAKIAGHEIGHLLGGAHERANCVEGIPSELQDDLASACTLMFNALDPASLNFSTLNGAVLRGYAIRYALP